MHYSLEEAVLEARRVMQMRRRFGEPPITMEARKAYLQQLADELLPIPLKGFSSQITEESLWHYISKTRYATSYDEQQPEETNDTDLISAAADKMSLVFFPPEEVSIAAGNAGRRGLMLIADYIIRLSQP